MTQTPAKNRVAELEATIADLSRQIATCQRDNVSEAYPNAVRHRQRLEAMRESAEILLNEARLQAAAEEQVFRDTRDRVHDEAEDIATTVTVASRRVDALARDLAVALDSRRAAIEALAPLMGAESVKRWLSREHATQALGKAGLRAFVELGGAPEADKRRLADHSENVIHANVTTEVTRLAGMAKNRAA